MRTTNIRFIALILVSVIILMTASCDNKPSGSTTEKETSADKQNTTIEETTSVEEASTSEETTTTEESTTVEETTKAEETTSGEETSTNDKTTEAHVHDYSEWTTTKQVTCIENGEQERVCACGEKETKITYSTGHMETIDEYVAPTCTETGLTKGKHCSACNIVLQVQAIVPANGHTEVIDEAVEATCVATGLAEGKHCSVCNAILVVQNITPIIAHTYDDRYDESCNKCGHIRDAECAHKDITIIVGVEATCTNTGLTNGCKCLKCGETLIVQQVISAKGHAEVIDNAIAATCTTTGSTEGKHCSVCNTILVAQTTIAAKGHTEVVDQAIEATCTTTGSTEGKHCSACDNILIAQSVIPVIDHIYDDKYDESCNKCGFIRDAECAHKTTEVIAGFDSTCTTPGLTNGTRCSKCDEILKKQEAIPSKGHTEVIDQAIAATCITTGLTEGKHCSVCNTILVAQTTISAKGHTEVIDQAIEATCTTTGLTEGKHCSVCNTILVAQTTISAKDHTEVIDQAVAATCTTTGLTEGKHCSVCNTVLVAQTTIAAKGHTEVIDQAVAATCTTTGLTEGKHCSVCNTVLVAQTTIAAKGHTEVIDQAIEATCITTGLTEGKHCSTCNTVIVAQSILQTKKHIYDYTSKICINCGREKFSEGLTYNLSNDGVSYSVSGIGTCLDEEIIIPSIYNNLPVTTIGVGAFKNETNISSVIIPTSIVCICYHAFYNCSNLSSINIPESVTKIIGNAFAGCTNIESISVDVNNTSYYSAGNCLIEYSTQALISGCKNSVIPSDGTIREIDSEAFYNCLELKDIIIPESVESIGVDAFYGCLNLIQIENGISYVGNWAIELAEPTNNAIIKAQTVGVADMCFYNCDSIISVTFPSSIKYINYAAFLNCPKLEDVYYLGTADQWQLVNIGYANNSLNSACNALYRYREIYYTESTTWLDQPWKYYDSYVIEYVHEDFAYELVFLNSDVNESGINVNSLDAKMNAKYCIHEAEYIYYYKNTSGNWVYGTYMQMSQYANGSWILSGSPGRATYRRYKYCTEKTPCYMYYFYSYSDWSDWSETSIQESDTIEVETKWLPTFKTS